MNEKNLHASTVAGFGDEWERFDQSKLPLKSDNAFLMRIFQSFRGRRYLKTRKVLIWAVVVGAGQNWWLHALESCTVLIPVPP